MDMENCSNDEQKIKLEVIETDYNSIFCKDEQLQIHIEKNFEIGSNSSDEMNLANHFVEHHQDDIKIESTISTDMTQLEENKKFHKCEHTNCGKSFRTNYLLKRHVKLHSERRPFKCGESGCAKSFRRKDHLINHMTVHKPQKEFKCNQPGCTKSYKIKRYLEDHMILHKVENPFKCSRESCGKTFASKRTLSDHLRLHNGDLPFKCNHQGCVKAYIRKDQLELHLQTHSLDSGGKDIIYCDYPECKSKFHLEHLYKKHVRRHELGKRYRCIFDQCDAAFFDGNDLKRHINVHTKNRFLCGLKGCKKSYARKFLLAAHQKTHTTIKQEGISIDEAQMSSQKVDEMENNYQCSICEETLSEEDEFEEHIKICGKYSTFEFIKVEEIETDNV